MDNDDEITPARVIREGYRWFPPVVVIGILAVVAVAIVTFVGYEAGWWFQAKAANKNYQITVNSQGYQQTLIHEMNSKLSDISDTALTRETEPSNSPMQAQQRAAQLGELRVFCTDANQLNPGTKAADQLIAVASNNCIAGAVAPNPPLAPIK